LNAIRYLARSGGGWRMLPKDFPPWPTVYWWFRRFVRRFLFQTIHDVALMLDRERVGREASPTGGVIDSQSVKAPEAKARGYDASKKIVGRKRHIAVDTDGRLLMVNLTTADISDSAGAQMILDSVRKRWPWLKHLFADSAYDRTKLMDKAAFLDFTIEIIKRSDTAQGFEVLPRRWVVEPTFGWMTRWRRLVRKLRGAHRLLPGHDPCRPRKYPPQTHRSPIDVLKRTLKRLKHPKGRQGDEAQSACRDGDCVADRDLGQRHGVCPEAGRHSQNVQPRQPGEHVHLGGGRGLCRGSHDGCLQQPRHVRPACEAEQPQLDRARSGGPAGRGTRTAPN